MDSHQRFFAVRKQVAKTIVAGQKDYHIGLQAVQIDCILQGKAAGTGFYRLRRQVNPTLGFRTANVNLSFIETSCLRSLRQIKIIKIVLLINLNPSEPMLVYF